MDDKTEEGSSFAQATMKYFWQQRHKSANWAVVTSAKLTSLRWLEPKSGLTGASAKERFELGKGKFSVWEWGCGGLPVDSHYMPSHHTRLHIHLSFCCCCCCCVKPSFSLTAAPRAKPTHCFPSYLYSLAGLLKQDGQDAAERTSTSDRAETDGAESEHRSLRDRHRRSHLSVDANRWQTA